MAAFGSVLANSSRPPQCHHPTCYVGWMRVSGTIWLSGIRSDMICFSFRCGLEFQYGETFTQFIMFLFCHNSYMQMHPGHWHDETQRDSQQVQVHPVGFWLHQQGAPRSGERRANVNTNQTRSEAWCCLISESLMLCVCAADDDSDQSERYIQRGAAHGGGWALVGLSAAGVLQPGD